MQGDCTSAPIYRTDSTITPNPNLISPRREATFSARPSELMRTKVIVALFAGVAALAVALTLLHPQSPSRTPESHETESSLPAQPPDLEAPRVTYATTPAPFTAPEAQIPAAPAANPGLSSTNRLERLMRIRETFRALAAGEPTNALYAAKAITNLNERETALLTLVTEWTQGELGSPQERASRIDRYGLEAGLGMELVKNPQLALLWADQLTSGAGRAALFQQTAIDLVSSDPTAAFGLSEQLPLDERNNFFAGLFAGWAGKDTDAALQWAGQLTDAADQGAAMQAIHSTAPVGIGAALTMQDGYAVINGLLPGTPAEASGQIHPGDRIVA